MATKEIHVMTLVREKSVVTKNDEDPTDTSNESKKMRSVFASSEETDTMGERQPRKYSSNYMMDSILFNGAAVSRQERSIASRDPAPILNSTFKPTPKMSRMSQTMNICKVCGDKASGFHYKVLSCDGCRGFFKRMVRGKSVAGCKYKDNCIITKELRNNCKSCRYKKCLMVGMDKCGVHSRRRKSKLDSDQNASEQQLFNSCTESSNRYSNEATVYNQTPPENHQLSNSDRHAGQHINQPITPKTQQLLVGRQNGELKRYAQKKANNHNNASRMQIPENMPEMLNTHFTKLISVVNHPSSMKMEFAAGASSGAAGLPAKRRNTPKYEVYKQPSSYSLADEKRKVAYGIVGSIINEITSYATFNINVLKVNTEQVVIMIERNWPGLFVLGLADHMRQERTVGKNFTQMFKESLKETVEREYKDNKEALEEGVVEIDSMFSLANDISLIQLNPKEYHFLRSVVLFHQRKLLYPKALKANGQENNYEQRHHSLQSFHFKYNFYTFLEMLMKKHEIMGEVVIKEMSILMNFLITFRNINRELIESQLNRIFHRDGAGRLDKSYWEKSLSA